MMVHAHARTTRLGLESAIDEHAAMCKVLLRRYSESLHVDGRTWLAAMSSARRNGWNGYRCSTNALLIGDMFDDCEAQQFADRIESNLDCACANRLAQLQRFCQHGTFLVDV